MVVVEEWTNLIRDAVDVGLKLRSPSKITLDINACSSDNKIKISLFKKYSKYVRSKIFRLKYVEMSMLFKKYAKMGANTIKSLL